MVAGAKPNNVFVQRQSPWQAFFISFDAQSLHGMSQGGTFTVDMPMSAFDGAQLANAGTTGATTSAITSTRLMIRSNIMAAKLRIAFEAYYTFLALGHR